MRIYLPMRIDADIRIIRHMSDIARHMSDNAEVDADIHIGMAIPSTHRVTTTARLHLMASLLLHSAKCLCLSLISDNFPHIWHR